MSTSFSLCIHYTNTNGVTSPENILIVITGIRITSLVGNIIYRWLLGVFREI